MDVMVRIEVEVLEVSDRDFLYFEPGCKGSLCTDPDEPEVVYVMFYPNQEGVKYNPTGIWAVGYLEDEGVKFITRPVA